MRSYEKKISFLNRYFVFKKIRVVNTETLIKSILEHAPNEMRLEAIQSKIAEDAVISVKEKEKEKKPRVKKLSTKITLQEATEAKSALEDQVSVIQPVINQVIVETEVEPEAGPIKIKKTTRKKKLVIDNNNL